MSNIPAKSSSDKDEFRKCVLVVFRNWSALQLAVDHGMGGSPQESNQKVSDMVDSITNMCFSTNVTDWKDIAFELEDMMDTYFDTILEDESPDEVGNLVWDLSRKWLSGDKESVGNYILSLNKVPVKHHVKSRSVSDTVEEMETLEEELGQPTPVSNVPCEDGWTVVTKTRRNH